jgi:PAS domain S-box-containing protein
MGESELFARATLDSLSAHIAIIDGSGAIVEVNKAWRKFAEANGAVGNVVEGSNYLRVCDTASGDQTEFATAFAEGIRMVLSGQQSEFAMEYPCHSPTQRRWFVGRVTRFPDDGSPRAVIAHEDVTERKLGEEALARALEARTEFMADVSHELRTPLTVIRGNADIGLRIRQGGDYRRILQDIAGEADRMSRMVEDLLFLARSDSEELPLELQIVPVTAVLEGLKRRAEALVREHGASLHTALAGEGSLRCDLARIEQAALALIDNAAKHGTSDGPITLTSRTQAGELVIEVSDRGPGVPREELPRIFERFYRAGGSAGDRGSGLGLPIARTIVETHGGRIEAASRANEGTRVSIYLPLAEGS